MTQNLFHRRLVKPIGQTTGQLVRQTISEVNESKLDVRTFFMHTVSPAVFQNYCLTLYIPGFVPVLAQCTSHALAMYTKHMVYSTANVYRADPKRMHLGQVQLGTCSTAGN